MKYPAILGGLASILLATGASAQWSEDFDGYADGTVLDNVDGWAGWDDDGSMAAIVSNDQSRSAPHSAAVGNGGSDAVHLFSGYTSGQWSFTAHVWVPSDLDGITYFILNNDYTHGGPYDWAVEIDMDPATGTAREVFRDPDGTMTAPLVYDQWVEIRVDFDLDANTSEVYYNDALVGAGPWDAYSGSGILELEALDLYAPHSATVYWDDLSLESADGCIADFNGDSNVNTQDVIAFLNAWNAGTDNADVNGDGNVNTQDVILFLNLWNAGC